MTINKKLSVRTFWSEENQEYVAQCDEHPSLSWLAASPDAAIDGLAELVRQVSKNEVEQEIKAAFCDGDIIDEKLDQRDRDHLNYLIDTRMTKDLQSYDEIIQERFDTYKREILNDVNQLIINVLNSKQSQGRSPDVLIHKRLTEIAQENAHDAEGLIVAAIAIHFKDLADGRVYQHLNNVYRKII